MVEVRAAEPPSVFNMSVSGSENGVSARCEFSGYRDKNEYVIQLFLNQVKADGQTVEAAFEELTPTADGNGTGSTAKKHVEAGIYKAGIAIKRYDGGNLAATDFTDSGLYNVVRDGTSYIVTPWTETSVDKEKSGGVSLPGKKKAKGRAEDKKDEKIYPGCDHDIVYDIVQEADPGKDALQVEQCSKCGEVFSYSDIPNSAYAAFLKESARAIQDAEGSEVFITTDRWMSFNQEVIDEIMAHPGISVTIHYQDRGKQYEVIIPVGTDVTGLVDENGYCGFRYLCQLYAGKEVFS